MSTMADAAARFSAVYDLDRIRLHEDAKTRRLYKPKPVTIRLEGGPLNGFTREYADLAPDWFESDEGHYVPYFARPSVYAWLPVETTDSPD